MRSFNPPSPASTNSPNEVYVTYRVYTFRRDFSRIVSGAHSAITPSRFARLAIYCFFYLAIGLPLAVWGTLEELKGLGIYYDYSFSYIHSTVRDMPLPV